MLAPPINLPKWLEDNGHLLRPPINNCCVYDGDVTVMIVGGPNSRTDYHVNPTPEWFFQYRGAMTLRVMDPEGGGDGGDGFRDVVIGEGCMLLLPALVPHNPVRFTGTVGLVVEQRRPRGALDRMRWYCAACRAARPRDPPVVVHEASFPCRDLGSQVREAVDDFARCEDKRACPVCGTRAPVAHEPGSVPDPNLA